MRVLYIEDSRFDADLTVRELARRAPRIKVELAATLTEARSLLTRDCPYDLVLSDLHFIEGSGLQLLNDIRSQRLPLAVVIITGFGDEESAIAALKAGADDYIVKREGYLNRLPQTLETALLRYRSESARISQPLRVLYAEQNSRDIELTQKHIGRHAQHIHLKTVRSAKGVIENVTAKEGAGWDILLLDYHLPEYNALELKKILAEEHQIDLPVVLVTDRGDEEMAAQAIRLGAYGYVVKHQGYLIELPSALESAFNRYQLKQEKSALKISEEKYRTLFETMTQGVVYINAEGRNISANRSAGELLDLSIDEILEGNPPRPVWRAIKEDGSPLPHEEYPAMVALKTGRIVENVTMGLHYPDAGPVRWLMVNAVPQFKPGEPKPYLVYATFENITDRIRSETRIRHLNRVLRAIREINHLIVHERKAEVLIQKACNILTKHRGYNSVLIILVDESQAPVAWAEAGWGERFQALAKTLEKGELPPCCHRIRKTKNVSIIDHKDEICGSCPLCSKNNHLATMGRNLEHDGHTFGYLSVSIDNDLSTEVEETSIFKEMASDLSFGLANIAQSEAIVRGEKARKDMEVELRQAQKMEAIGRLAGGVAHDFNNMLSVISGYANLALMQLDSNDALYQNLVEIDQAAMRSADLTRQLLAFSRKQEIEPVVADLNDIVTKHLKMLERLIGENIEVEFTPSEDLWPVMIDLSQINQILANLAVNARDAIDDGVGVVSLQTRNMVFSAPKQDYFLDIQPGEYVLISFSDTGIGIDVETLEHIFEPFYTTKEEGKGTGLGLSTVYGIVKQNKGAVHVYSEPGMGTTFNIYLPRFEGDLDLVNEPDKLDDPPGTETILLVEDDDLVLNLAKTILERKGYQVLSAGMPGEAIELVKNHDGPIHLVLTDVIMPTMNGRQLKEQVDAIKPGIKTLFMSGYTADIISSHGVLETGINFIQKPFTLESLSTKVREILNQ